MKCFGGGGGGPSKRELIEELDGQRAATEAENRVLKGRVADLSAQLAASNKDRDGHARARAELEAALQLKSQRTLGLLTQCVRVKGRADELLLQVPAAAELQPGQWQQDDEHGSSAPSSPRLDANVHVGFAGDEGAGGEPSPSAKPSIEEQLERSLSQLEAAQEGLAAHLSRLTADLQAARSDGSRLRAEVEDGKRSLAQQEAAGAAQLAVQLQRCAALEQENEQLAGLNTELEARLEVLKVEVGSAVGERSTRQAQLLRQATDLQGAAARALAAEAEARALGVQLATALAASAVVTVEVEALRDQARSKASQLAAAEGLLAARTAELEEASGRLRQAQAELEGHKQQLAALAAQAKELQDSEREARASLESTKASLASSQRDCQAAQLQLHARGEDLAAAQLLLADVQAQALDSGARLVAAEDELAVWQAKASEATAAHLATKQQLITTSKSLAAMAKDHGAALGRLHSLEGDAPGREAAMAGTQQQLEAACAQLEAQAVLARQRAEEAEEAGRELRQLRAAHASATAELRRRVMLLTAIAHMAGRGARGPAGSQEDAEAADAAEAAMRETSLKLKVCEAPLGLVGRVTRGITESSRLRQLALDLDLSREDTFEKAGLRICCLAAAVGLNHSLETLQLSGWTWQELGSGAALPFLPLGASGGMLRSMQMATNLFDYDSAAMLKDLLAGGLVDLAGSGGKGVLLLYSGNERLDAWYGQMIGDVQQQQQAAEAAAAASPAAALRRGPGSASSRTSSATASGAVADAAAPLSSASSFRQQPAAASVAGSVAASGGARPGAGLAAASVASGATSASAATAAGGPALECDLSQEALESHHMVLVMAVLLVCPRLRRLRLDGNKLGDGGAEMRRSEAARAGARGQHVAGAPGPVGAEGRGRRRRRRGGRRGARRHAEGQPGAPGAECGQLRPGGRRGRALCGRAARRGGWGRGCCCRRKQRRPGPGRQRAAEAGADGQCGGRADAGDADGGRCRAPRARAAAVSGGAAGRRMSWHRRACGVSYRMCVRVDERACMLRARACTLQQTM